jgi:hypothetical protein
MGRAGLFIERFLDDAHGRQSCRSPTVRRRVNDGFYDLSWSESVPESSADMDGQFVVLIQGDQNSEIEETSASAVEPGPRPHCTPDCFRDVCLEGFTFGAGCALQ